MDWLKHVRNAKGTVHGGIVMLLLLAALVVFPFGWIAKVWPGFGQSLNTVLATSVEHAIGHWLLFFAAGWAALSVLRPLAHSPAIYIACMLALGMAQEAMQIAYKHRPVKADDGFDLLVDLTGSACAFLAWSFWQKRQVEQEEVDARS